MSERISAHTARVDAAPTKGKPATRKLRSQVYGRNDTTISHAAK